MVKSLKLTPSANYPSSTPILHKKGIKIKNHTTMKGFSEVTNRDEILWTTKNMLYIIKRNRWKWISLPIPERMVLEPLATIIGRREISESK